MKAVFSAALPACALLLAAPAFAQDDLASELAPESEAPRGLLGLELPENQERQEALLLNNFLAMDLNLDRLIAKSEWDVWSGWRGSAPPDFTMVDGNASSYLSYREYVEAATSVGDSRMAEGIHGAVFPEGQSVD